MTFNQVVRSSSLRWLTKCLGLKKILNIHIILRPVGQAVKTSPFHGGNTGSIPVGVILNIYIEVGRCGSIGRAADL